MRTDAELWAATERAITCPPHRLRDSLAELAGILEVLEPDPSADEDLIRWGGDAG